MRNTPRRSAGVCRRPDNVKCGHFEQPTQQGKTHERKILKSPMTKGDGRLAGGVVGLHSPVTTTTGDPTHLENWAAKGAMPLGPREGNTSTGARQSSPSHHVVFEMCATYALSNAGIAPAKVLPPLGSFTSIPKQRVFFHQRNRKNKAA